MNPLGKVIYYLYYICTLPAKHWLQPSVEPGDHKWAEAIHCMYACELHATNISGVSHRICDMGSAFESPMQYSTNTHTNTCTQMHKPTTIMPSAHAHCMKHS